MGKIFVCEKCKKSSCSGQLYSTIGEEHNIIVCESDTYLKDGRGRMTRYVRGQGQEWDAKVVRLPEKRKGG